MKFAIAVMSSPHAPATRRALRFTEAALAAGHDVVRVFFYGEGVHTASASLVVPQDEVDVGAQWRSLIAERQLDAVVCIAAGLRRGILNAEEAARWERPAAAVLPPIELSGLGQLHEAAQHADRLICFGGD